MDTTQNINIAPILVVDDDAATRTMLEMVLESEGYPVLLAGNGQEALDIAQQQPTSLVLLDLMMPVVDGWQFLEAAKNSPVLQSLPVVLLSASRDVANVAAQNNVKAYISKPFDLSTLLAYIKRYTEAQ